MNEWIVVAIVAFIAITLGLSLMIWDNWKSGQEIMQSEADYNAQKAKKIGQGMKKL